MRKDFKEFLDAIESRSSFMNKLERISEREKTEIFLLSTMSYALLFFEDFMINSGRWEA